ncbi:NmrA-like domain-containing protein 1 [Bulinus truncatus]|nr:NmrA-like domain-containing protein 1 [Bulinus truncatus]
MAQKKVVVIFGVDHLVGQSVAKTLVNSGDYLVRGVSTTDQNGEQSPRVAGVEYFNIDPTDASLIQPLLQEAELCFIYTKTNLNDPHGIDAEISYGCLIADCCKDNNVRHTIFCSQLNSNEICSLMARHLMAKAEIEKYMRSIGLNLTCLILPVLYQDIVDVFKPTFDGRSYNIEIPMGTVPLDLMNVEDVGPIVATVLQHSDNYFNKTLSICGDKKTIKQIAEVLSKCFHPKVFKDKQVTPYEFQLRRSQELAGCSDLANMFQFFQRVDQRYNLSVSKQMNPRVTSFDDWVKNNKDKLSLIFK